MSSWTLPAIASPRLRKHLHDYLERVLRPREEELEFAVLYGSAARGDFHPGSDLDLLVGLREDGEADFGERMRSFQGFNVNVFPYYPSEVVSLVEQFHPTLLEASDHGKTLFDRGRWGEIAGSFRSLVEAGRVVKRPRGWRVVDPALLRR